VPPQVICRTAVQWLLPLAIPLNQTGAQPVSGSSSHLLRTRPWTKLRPGFERRIDIPLLVESFVAGFSRSLGKPLRAVNARSLDVLMAYEWPGNVRELLDIIERAAILARAGIIEVFDLMRASNSTT
jgi:hypothetical protein